MVEADLKTLTRRIVGVFASGDLSEVDTLIAVDYLDHQDGRRGREAFIGAVERVRSRLAELTVKVEDIIAEDDRVCVRLSWRGRDASGAITYPISLDVLRFTDGRAVEHWGLSTGWPS